MAAQKTVVRKQPDLRAAALHSEPVVDLVEGWVRGMGEGDQCDPLASGETLLCRAGMPAAEASPELWPAQAGTLSVSYDGGYVGR